MKLPRYVKNLEISNLKGLYSWTDSTLKKSGNWDGKKGSVKLLSRVKNLEIGNLRGLYSWTDSALKKSGNW